MSANCPNCGKALKWYNVKAECPDCGVSIPNFNWEARLEEDNKIAEEKFAALYKTTNRLKYSLLGNKLRIARLIMSLVPAVGFILPWVTFKSSADSLSFDLLGIFTDGHSTIDFFGILFKDIGAIFTLMGGEGFSGPVSMIIIGLLLMLLSVVAIVIAFFMPIVRFKKSDTKAGFIADIISVIFAVGAAVVFFMSDTAVSAGDFSLGALNFSGASSSVMWGLFVYIALLVVALTGNILVSKSNVTSDEALEAVRAEKVRIKEEKLEEARIKKEAARLEAQKRAQQEQEEKLQKAKQALAEKEKNK